MSLDAQQKRDLLLKLLSGKNQLDTGDNKNDIAIIGLNGRYPQSPSLDDFWKNLCGGKNCISDVPADRWNWQQFSGKESDDYSRRRAGFIADVDKFDPLFFGISPREAERMDPQERLFLESSWHAIEDAGYTPETLSKEESRVGVFAGVMNANYSIMGSQSWQENLQQNKVYACNPTFWSIANRISFTFDFTGPSFAVDSACSSSLTAIHLACESLKRGECEVALAGGVNLILHPAQLDGLAKMNMLSKKGNCHTFGADSDGFTDGEGVGVIILKPLAKALKDKDNIYAVIQASAVNSGGKTSGYTVPNPNAQAKLIEKTIKQAGINPRDISYIEAHGTGTQLGDPIEIRGLGKAFQQFTQDKKFCAIGSVKSNIGHLESAAGVSALTKVLLQFKNKKLVPSINASQLNAKIDFDNSPFYLQRNLEDWCKNEKTYAGISSFGAGGANAHIILRSAPAVSVSNVQDSDSVIYLSAKSPEQLKTYARQLHGFIAEKSTDKTNNLTNIAYTLAVGRESFANRLAIVTNGLRDLHEKLTNFLQGREHPDIKIGAVESDQSFENFTTSTSLSLKEMAGHWVSGKSGKYINAEKDSVKRISLPLYPFLKERYWINSQNTDSKSQAPVIQQPKISAPVIIPAKPVSPEGVLNIQPVWVPAALDLAPVSREIENLFFFCKDIAQVNEISASMPLTPKKIFWAVPGNENKILSPGIYQYSLESKSLFNAGIMPCLEECQSANIIFALTQGSSRNDQDGIQSLLLLSQLLIENKNTGNMTLSVWNDDRKDIAGVIGNAATGFVKSLKIERPEFSLQHVQFENGEEFYSVTEQMQKITDEIRSGLTSPIVKYSAGNRLVEKLSVVDFPQASNKSVIQEGATYLITGGAGGLGSIIASAIAKTGKVNLILTGRSPIDQEKEKLIQSLSHSKNEVIYIPCDVSKESDVDLLFEKIANRFGNLNAVIHSAGVLNDCLIQMKNWDNFRSLINTKTQAIQYLDNASRHYNLDFFVAFSSVTSVLGNFGQTDYAYANSFLDYFTHWRNQQVATGTRSGTSISINWPIWAEGGMHIDSRILKTIRENVGIIPLGTENGLQVFFSILANSIHQLAPIYGIKEKLKSYLDKSGLLHQSVISESKPIISERKLLPVSSLDESISVTILKEQKDADISGIITPKLLKKLREFTSDILDIHEAKINNDQNFGNYGFDSITLQEFANKINREFSISFSTAMFYSHQSLNKLTEFMVSEYTKDFIEAFGVVESQENSVIENTQFDIDNKSEISLEDNYVHETESEINRQENNCFEVNAEGDSLNVNEEDINMEIAIIGMDAVFPGASNVEQFWENIKSGVDSISEIPENRWRWEDHYGNSFGTANKTNSKWGGFIEGVDLFDYEFFEVSKREADFMDPQQRLFLQSAWHAIEHSGYNPRNLKNYKVGVFAGVEFNDYKDLLADYGHVHAEMAIGNAHNMIANRVSYFLDLNGPSESVDTACSSSLVAISRAARSIQAGECNFAIAGGVNVALSPKTMIGTSQLNIYSPDGRCKTLDKNANGYVKGEGVGIVVLKPLKQAQADGDNILGVIKSYALNHGGRSSSITAPNSNAQAELLLSAYQKAKIHPEQICYVEMHGTGTRLGDPVEIDGIKKALKKLSGERGLSTQKYCGIGSVKTNIGHLEPASGVAGLLKVLFALKHQQLPPNLHFQELNPLINLDDTPLYVVRELTDIHPALTADREPLPLVAGVSSFGFGGSNAHLVVQQWINKTKTHNLSNKDCVIPLSAKTTGQLKQQAADLYKCLEINRQYNLSDVAFTLQTGRHAMDCRVAFLVNSIDELIHKLKAYIDDGVAEYSGQQSVNSNLLTELMDTDFVGHLLQKNDLGQMAKWWVKGLNLNWSQLYSQGSCNRIALPTYPFNKQRCWIPFENSLQPINKIANAAAAIPENQLAAVNISENIPVTVQTLANQSQTTQSQTAPEFNNIVIREVALLCNKSESEIKPEHHLSVDLNLDSIKMMGLINELISKSSPSGIEQYNKMGMNTIINKSKKVSDLIEIFSELTIVSEKPQVQTGTTIEAVPLLDAQMVFLPAYFLTKSSSLCSFVDVTGSIDLEVASTAWEKLIERHPSLQLILSWPKDKHNTLGGISASFVSKLVRPQVVQKDISQLSEFEQEKFVDNYFHEKLNFQWSITDWPLHEISVIKRSNNRSSIFWSNEHIISDGLSNQLALKEFLEIYECLINRQALPEIQYSKKEEYVSLVNKLNQYVDDLHYVESLNSSVDSELAKSRFEFNPESKKRDIASAHYTNISFQLSDEKTQKIVFSCGKTNFSLNGFLTTAFIKAINKINPNKSDLLVQIPTSGRLYQGIDFSRSIGCFAQSLSLAIPANVINQKSSALMEHIQDSIDGDLANNLDRIHTKELRSIIESIPLDHNNDLPEYARQMMLANLKSNLYFPYTGKTGIEKSYADLQVNHYRAGTSNSPGAIDFLQEIHQQQLHISINYDDTYFSQSLINKLLEEYLKELDGLLESVTLEAKSITKTHVTETTVLLRKCFESVTNRQLEDNQLSQDFESQLGLDSLDKIKFVQQLPLYFKMPLNKRELVRCKSLAEMQKVIEPSAVFVENSAVFEDELVSKIESSSSKNYIAPDESFSISPGITKDELPISFIIRQCEKTPDAIAVTNYKGQSITYAQLQSESNRLAQMLKKSGVKKGDYVGLISHRGPMMITAIVAIMKTGAAYVPVDPVFPDDRIQYILSHAKIKTLITESVLNSRIFNLLQTDPTSSKKVDVRNLVFMDNPSGDVLEKFSSLNKEIIMAAQWQEYPDLQLNCDIQPEDDMVVLFTSGSTGNPKGVYLHHLGYANRLMWHQKIFQLQPGEKVAQKTSCSFDVAIWEHLWPIMYGGCVCAVEKDIVSNPWDFADWMVKEKIAVAHFVPSMFGEFVNSLADENHTFPDLRWLIFSGEALPTATVQRWIDQYGLQTGLCNLYGPTEASIDVSYHFINRRPEDHEPIPIGKAVDNTVLFVRDEKGNRLPKDVMGELCIAGNQLAKGYLYEPELTAKSFLINTYESVPGDIVYATGDLAIERDGGVIEYHGRKDNQVKLRGFRIELGEIEHVATSHKSIDEAACLVVDEKLILWYSGKSLTEAEIKSHIGAKCPAYMLPHQIIRLEKLPKNSNGKLDRKVILSSLQVTTTTTTDQEKNQSVCMKTGPAQQWLFNYFEEPYEWWGFSRIALSDDFIEEKFLSAINNLVMRHDALRTQFIHVDNEIMQEILHGVQVTDFIRHDFSNLSNEEYEIRLTQEVRTIASEISINQWPLFKLAIFKHANGKELMWVSHHAISDMISGYVVNRDVWSVYRDGSNQINNLSPGYSDYVDEIASLCDIYGEKNVIDFWKKYSSKNKYVIQLPFDHQVGDNIESSYQTITLAMPSTLINYLQIDGREYFDTSFYNILSAAVYKLMAVKLRKNWIVISHKLNGRHLPGSNKSYFETVGNFAVNVPAGVSIKKNGNFRDIIRDLTNEMKEMPLGGLSYDWVGNLLPDNAYPDSQLTGIRINYLGDVSTANNNDMQLSSRYALPQQKRTCQLEFFFYTKDKVTYLEIGYSSNLYSKDSISTLADQYVQQLQLMADEVIPEVLPTN